MAEWQHAGMPGYKGPLHRGPDDWPIPFQPVWGPDDSVWRKVECLLARGTLSVIGRLPEFVLGPRVQQDVVDRHVERVFGLWCLDLVGITAQLIDARTDTHLYSENFDRTVDGNAFFVAGN